MTVGMAGGKLGKGRAFKALEPGSHACTRPSKQAIPPSREQLSGGLGIRFTSGSSGVLTLPLVARVLGLNPAETKGAAILALEIVWSMRQRRRQQMYYRLAIQRGGDHLDGEVSWQWQSTALSSLQSLFQVLRLYGALPQ